MEGTQGGLRRASKTCPVKGTICNEGMAQGMVLEPLRNSLANMTSVAAGSTKSRFARDAARATPTPGHLAPSVIRGLC